MALNGEWRHFYPGKHLYSSAPPKETPLQPLILNSLNRETRDTSTPGNTYTHLPEETPRQPQFIEPGHQDEVMGTQQRHQSSSTSDFESIEPGNQRHLYPSPPRPPPGRRSTVPPTVSPLAPAVSPPAPARAAADMRRFFEIPPVRLARASANARTCVREGEIGGGREREREKEREREREGRKDQKREVSAPM